MLSLFFLCLCLKSHICFGADTITANQSLSGDQTIVSAGGKFELGFFEAGNTANYYIGMWYYKKLVPDQTIVWVANRVQPVSDRFSSELRISDGNLVLFNESKTPIWATNVSSSSASFIHVVLLDNGNLALRAGSLPLWQSFDQPAHTFLPESKLGFNNVTKRTQLLTSWKNSEDPAPGPFSLELDATSNSFIIKWNRSQQYWTTGFWDQSRHRFSLLSEMLMPNHIFNFRYVTNENESYFTYSLYGANITSRLIMDVSGQVKQLSWLHTGGWKLLWIQPKNHCDVYGLCGAFSRCSEKPLPLCNCLNGYEPKSKVDWDLQDYSLGCSRKTRLQCGNVTGVDGMSDRFIEMSSRLSSEDIQIQNLTYVHSIEDCESICLNDCNCTAYGYSSSSSECSTWKGDMWADENGRTLYIRTAASDYKNPTSNVMLIGRKRTIVIATVSATAGLLTIVFGHFLWKNTLGKRSETIKNLSAAGVENDTELPLYSLRSILVATNNFSEANKLGEGGFGPVYKGILPENQEVAIKRLSKKSGQGQQEFMNELKLIAKLQHTNLVRLLGCCIEAEEMILVYEYMPNRSLDKFLFDPSEKTKLDWGRRFRIIEGIAQGLLYIHKYSRLRIIHRDLKASNILLDGTMNPKISDFGMAKIFDINQTEANTNRVVGTYGYMSPEYARYGHFSEKSDVFSFGVLLLEIVSGKKNAVFYRSERSLTLAGWAWDLWNEGRGIEVIDASIREIFQAHEALRCIHVGLLCVQESAADRPTMASVIHMLQGNEATSLPPTKEPAFSTQKNFSAIGSSQRSTNYSNNALTISLPEAR
ncbi:putative protein kinase RLK-Pelle-DLSV family [Rosa chinensis]|uniref:Receptor-like serine/threonine-protein kinase n=1 Tax=Rosa chinensis TaxID=74649 RepID=A0A2P6S898_ROSCH|nr:putative protein kinase RLK-Pelle-DLSV family [Rosa chinensis]